MVGPLREPEHLNRPCTWALQRVSYKKGLSRLPEPMAFPVLGFKWAWVLRRIRIDFL